MKKTGLLAAVGYVLTVVGANLAIGHWGHQAVPNAPHTIPVWFGYNAPSGVLFVSLALVTRDYVQWALGRDPKRPADRRVITVMVALILAGSGLSWVAAHMNPQPPHTHIILGSAVAFLASESIDFLIFSVVALARINLREPRWARAVLIGGLAGAVADSLIFLAIAFGSLQFWQGQIIGKSYGIVLAAAVIALRLRRVRLARPQAAVAA